MPLDPKAIAQNIFAALGGTNSRLQQPRLVYLGNPALGKGSDPRLPEGQREYIGQVWVHEGGGAFASQDDDNSARDDLQPTVYTAMLKGNTIPSGRVRYGTPVYVQTVNGLLQIVDEGDVEAQEYLYGVPEHETSAIPVELFAYGLLRATNPPSAAVELVGALYQVGDDLYEPPTLVTGDLISSYAINLTGNQAKAVQVLFDPATQTISYTAGTAFNDSWYDARTGINDHIGAFANYPATNADPTLFNVGWIKFRNGQTLIQPMDVLPGPGFFNQGGGGGALPVVPVNKGGTNITSYTTGDILYASASDTLAKLAIGSTDDVLTVAGGLPSWAAPTGGSGSTMDGGAVRRSLGSPQTISDDNVATLITFNTEDWEGSTYVDLGSNNDRITVPAGKDGVHLLTWHVHAYVTGSPANSYFGIEVIVYRNEADFLMAGYAHDVLEDVFDNKLSTSGSHPFAFTEADYVYMEVTVDTGGNHDVDIVAHLSLSKWS